MLKKEATAEGVTVFTSGAGSTDWPCSCSNSCQVGILEQGKRCLPRDRVPQRGSSGCHPSVNMFCINDEMSKAGLCCETISLMLFLLRFPPAVAVRLCFFTKYPLTFGRDLLLADHLLVLLNTQALHSVNTCLLLVGHLKNPKLPPTNFFQAEFITHSLHLFVTLPIKHCFFKPLFCSADSGEQAPKVSLAPSSYPWPEAQEHSG